MEGGEEGQKRSYSTNQEKHQSTIIVQTNTADKSKTPKTHTHIPEVSWRCFLEVFNKVLPKNIPSYVCLVLNNHSWFITFSPWKHIEVTISGIVSFTIFQGWAFYQHPGLHQPTSPGLDEDLRGWEWRRKATVLRSLVQVVDMVWCTKGPNYLK